MASDFFFLRQRPTIDNQLIHTESLQDSARLKNCVLDLEMFLEGESIQNRLQLGPALTKSRNTG